MLDPKIPQIQSYNQHMSMSIIDKIFFLDKINASVIVDFGCADGAMVKRIAEIFDNFTYIGFDASEEMVDIANKDNPYNILFTSSWEKVVEEMNKIPGKKTIVLSSLIHEVYSYCSEVEIAEFWDRVWNSDFDYVVIREMVVSKTTSRQSDPISVARIRQCYDKNKLHQWESTWGSIDENWSLVHFLLTYRYEENWEREYKENYLPVALEDFMTMIPKKYYPTYYEHYNLPFIRQKVEEDFGVQLQDRTHLKLILTLK